MAWIGDSHLFLTDSSGIDWKDKNLTISLEGCTDKMSHKWFQGWRTDLPQNVWKLSLEVHVWSQSLSCSPIVTILWGKRQQLEAQAKYWQCLSVLLYWHAWHSWVWVDKNPHGDAVNPGWDIRFSLLSVVVFLNLIYFHWSIVHNSPNMQTT